VVNPSPPVWLLSGVTANNPLPLTTSMEERERCYSFVLFRHLKIGCNKIKNILLLSTFIPLRGVGTACFYHVVIKIRHLFYDQSPAWRQPSLKLEWMLTTVNAAGTNSLTCLPKHGGARCNKFWSPIQWLTSMNVLSFHDQTLSARSSSSLS
jgi:hypothetical protein